MQPKFDERDAEILAKRQALFDQRPGPRVGDYVHTPLGLLRFTHDWGDSIQTTSPNMRGDASFYLGDGFCSFSGSLAPSIPKDQIEDTGNTAQGGVWFFHHDHRMAHNGVYTKAVFRVYRVINKGE